MFGCIYEKYIIFAYEFHIFLILRPSCQRRRKGGDNYYQLLFIERNFQIFKHHAKGFWAKVSIPYQQFLNMLVICLNGIDTSLKHVRLNFQVAPLSRRVEYYECFIGVMIGCALGVGSSGHCQCSDNGHRTH